jgi:hypothetical protein
VKKDLLRTGPPTAVVDVVKLQNQLECSGSAEIATLMIRKPEQQDINWK